MIIKRVILENVFAYEGINEFYFSTSGKKNISLIIGENGFGKTSFINAIKIGFHGITKDILKIGNKYIPKIDFIKGNNFFEGLISKNKKYAKIEIETDKFTIIREFKEDDSLTLIKDDEKFYDLEAEDLIETIFPKSLNKFFFFDGEKIQEIANFENEEFKKMLEAVLRLDIYDMAIEDLDILLKKYIKENLDKETLDRINCFEKEEIIISQKLQNLDEEYKNLKELLKEKQKIEKSLINESSIRKKLEKKLFKKNEEFQELLREFKEIILYKLPLLLNPKLFEKMKNDINNYDDLGIDREILLKKKKEFFGKIQNKTKELEKIFDEIFLKEKKGFINSSKVLPLLNFEKIDLKGLLDKLSKLKSEIENITQQMKETDNDLFNEIHNIQKEIINIENRMKNIEEEIFTLKENLINIKKEIRQFSKIEFENRLLKEKIKTIENSIKALKEIKQSLKTKKRPKLEKIINKKFQKLKKESFNIKKIVLTDDFNIYLINKNNEKLSVLSASSGQKQIIATALIWGVSEYLNKEIPMIIDTPLGRLDIENQKLILKEFYPNASKQVIILPTPSEIRNEEFKILNSYISDTYCLYPQNPKVRKCELPNL
jgi:DNA sulfur modification protein DndD